MKKSVHILLILLSLFSLPMEAQDVSLRFTQHYVTSNCHAFLSWNSIDSAASYTLYRQYPQGPFISVATISDTQYADTLRRVICADTVNYYVSATFPASQLISDTTGLYFQDNIPTSPCQLRLCSVDTALRQIRLSWYPSPDTDVMGYYICIGNPCLDYDTVWGRLNTSYLCPTSLDPSDTVHSFRILAFDSCFQSSPLTPSYHHPVLNIVSAPCSRKISCSWNNYLHMPNGVARYSLYYQLFGESDIHHFDVGPEGPFQFDTTIADLDIEGLRAWLCVVGSSDTLQAYSAVKVFNFSSGDMARSISITSVEYDPSLPSVHLSIEIDPLYSEAEIYLLRSRNDDSFDTHETLPVTSSSISYTDLDISRTATIYRYLAAAPDGCNQRFTYSDTILLEMPVIDDAMAFFPSAIVFGDSDRGRFCPQYLSPLAEGYSLTLFTRWGECIFQSSQLDACWDGTALDGRALPQGVYVYRAHCRFADATEHTYLGTVLLIK